MNIPECNEILYDELASLKNNTDTVADRFQDRLNSLGVDFPGSNYSLIVTVNQALLPNSSLNTDTKSKLLLWDLPKVAKIPIRVPKRETTGTHGSGERDKYAQAIRTISLDYSSEDEPEIQINPFGLYTGLYHKLVNELTLRFDPLGLQSLEIVEGNLWENFFREIVAKIRTLEKVQKWPDFALGQMDEIIRQ